MAVKEAHIRDYLAANLHLLEEGMSLVKIEYHLANPQGATGRIDILAQDRNGLWVIIEVKRAKGPARQALHEVTKYTELLRREKALRKDHIRSIIVSTSWSDLLTSASNLARDWEHDLKGYRITVGSDGAILQVEQIEWKPDPFDPRPTNVQNVELYASAEEREHGWQKIKLRAQEAHARNVVGFDFDRVRDIETVVGKYALYYAIGRISPELVPLQADLDVVPDEGDEDNPWFEIPTAYQQNPAEYRALHHICRQARGARAVEVGNPDKFTALLGDDRWQLQRVRRSGAYATSDVLGDTDLCNAVSGKGAGAQILYTGSADPRIRLRWSTFTQEALGPLVGNNDWSLLLRQWFEEAVADPTCTDVRVHVYNPSDLVQTLIYGLTDKTRVFEQYVPNLTAVAKYSDGRVRATQGYVAWDGERCPDLIQRVRLVFREPLHYAAYRWAGEVWTVDSDLLALLGLRYVFLDVSQMNENVRLGEFRIVDNGEICRFDGPGEQVPYFRPDGMPFILRDFVYDNWGEVNGLVQDYLKVLHIS
ncbi:endonuclease NucS domain-containing protein [Marinitenerispora sediminis]|uniref:Endonuclease NucS C-terminal domain-containing protein n=1 Tax=Marinitenerispora sediminis TaxID=1931232 RepID=A0A368T4C4_9ACTN|nr:endonuclease NucS domain-containing protein [Marinitenerispora sediminis]RCV49710.1 hypothetical protein DEF28_20135 [Marinitenerispora sediminis]RCV53348.1 hypothetical protein DEF23_17725 [Marinitenerispora sediminis]RCV57562.1 hypothetical protein DEF24_15045 [Marinitenerispora sediminis]